MDKDNLLIYDNEESKNIYNFRVSSFLEYYSDLYWVELIDDFFDKFYSMSDLFDTYDQNPEYLEYLLSQKWFKIVDQFYIDPITEKDYDRFEDNIKKVLNWDLYFMFIDDFTRIVFIWEDSLKINNEKINVTSRVQSLVLCQDLSLIEYSYNNYCKSQIELIKSLVSFWRTLLINQYPEVSVNEEFLLNQFLRLSWIWFSYPNYFDDEEFIDFNNLDVYTIITFWELLEKELWLLKALLEWKLPFVILDWDRIMVLDKLPIDLLFNKKNVPLLN